MSNPKPTLHQGLLCARAEELAAYALVNDDGTREA